MSNINILKNEDLFKVDSLLNNWLIKEFDYVYKHNGFYIVANEIKPIYSLKDTTGRTIWKEMIKIVSSIMVKYDYRNWYLSI